MSVLIPQMTSNMKTYCCEIHLPHWPKKHICCASAKSEAEAEDAFISFVKAETIKAKVKFVERRS